MNIEQSLKKLGLKRYKNKVGKSIGGFVYLHKDYIDQFPDYLDYVETAEKLLPKNFRWNCLKINQKTLAVTFINSPDFDTADEPVSLDNYTVDVHGELKYYKPPASPLIWHHKWLWVMDDYSGFDVEESKERSVFWNEQLEDHPDPRIKSKIGQQKVWNELPFNKNKVVKSSLNRVRIQQRVYAATNQLVSW